MGADVSGGKSTRGLDIDVMIDGGAEWGGKEKGVVVEVLVAGDKAKEVRADEIMLGDPDLLTILVEDVELVGVLVFDVSTGGGFKEMGEECGIDLVCRRDRGNSKYIGGRWCRRWDGGNQHVNNGKG